MKTTTGNPKDLDSVMIGLHYSISQVVRDIVLHYCPQRGILVDPMCGNGVFYNDWNPEDFGFIPYFSDIDKTDFAQYIQDARSLHTVFITKADVIVFDPPYPINMAGCYNKKKNNISRGRYTQNQFGSFVEFELFVKDVDISFSKIISEKGILIAKVQDVHRNKKFVPYHMIIPDWFSSFTLFDIVIYRNFYSRAPWHSNYAHNTHSYFLVFKPKDKQQKNLDELLANNQKREEK